MTRAARGRNASGHRLTGPTANLTPPQRDALLRAVDTDGDLVTGHFSVLRNLHSLGLITRPQQIHPTDTSRLGGHLTTAGRDAIEEMTL